MGKGHGGFRNGSGRKKGAHTIAAEKAREYVVQQVAANLGPLMRAKLDKALGAFVFLTREKVFNKETEEYERTGRFIIIKDPQEIEEVVAEGGTHGEDYWRLSTEEADGNAIQYLLNQAIGKPKETTELSGVGGGPVEFRWESDAPKKKPPVVILKR